MENPIKMDDLGGKPTIFGNIHMVNKRRRHQPSLEPNIDIALVLPFYFGSMFYIGMKRNDFLVDPVFLPNSGFATAFLKLMISGMKRTQFVRYIFLFNLK